MLPPIVICSVFGKCFPVLAASIEHYVPDGVEIYLSTCEPIAITDTRHKWHILPNTANNFGDAYNAVIEAAFADGHSGVIMANDDIVLTPNSYNAMVSDLTWLLEQPGKVGLVGCLSDHVWANQNIRTKLDNDEFVNCQWQSERDTIKSIPYVAPIFAWVSAAAFGQCRFPPINGFGDVVISGDLSKLGYRHFVSRAYVHHVGGQTVSRYDDGETWLRHNRPELAREIFGEVSH